EVGTLGRLRGLPDRVHVRHAVRFRGPAAEDFVSLESTTGGPLAARLDAARRTGAGAGPGVTGSQRTEISRRQSDPWVVPDFRRTCPACRRRPVRKRLSIPDNRRRTPGRVTPPK